MIELKRTPLYNEHLNLKARMVPFGGWEMPVQYSGVMDEHRCVRTRVGLFDVSHMGQFFISGTKAAEFLNSMTTNDIDKLYDGRCQYTLLCYENGTVVDDLIISQLASNRFIAVVNASNIEKDYRWLIRHQPDGVEIRDQSADWGLLAIQGPKSGAVVQELLEQDLSGVLYYHFIETTYQNHTGYLFRTGYTGEDGFELMLPKNVIVSAWKKILDQGSSHEILPIGLGARDTLRIEAAYSLYGHEISDAINPLEANLSWVIRLKKGQFIGRESLIRSQEEGLKRKIVGFEMMDAGIARDGFKVFDGTQEIGYVTSGTHSPTLNQSIGLALILREFSQEGKELSIDIRGKMKRARIIKTPFYKKESP